MAKKSSDCCSICKEQKGECFDAVVICYCDSGGPKFLSK